MVGRLNFYWDFAYFQGKKIVSLREGRTFVTRGKNPGCMAIFFKHFRILSRSSMAGGRRSCGPDGWPTDRQCPYVVWQMLVGRDTCLGKDQENLRNFTIMNCEEQISANLKGHAWTPLWNLKINSLLQNRFELPSFFHVPVVFHFSGTGCTSEDFWFQRNTTCGDVKTGALQMISKRLYDRRKSFFFFFFSDGFLMMRMLPNKKGSFNHWFSGTFDVGFREGTWLGSWLEKNITKWWFIIGDWLW